MTHQVPFQDRLRKAVLEGVVIPAIDIGRKRRTVRKLNELRKTQYWQSDQIRELQTGRCRRMLNYASRYVPYYRELFRDIGFNPKTDLKSLDTLQQIPILTKRQIRERFDAFLSEDISSRRWCIDRTGGSTGEPTKFIQDADKMGYLRAAMQRSFEWAGTGWGCRQVVISGSSFDSAFASTVVGHLKLKLLNILHLDSFGVNEKIMQEWVKKITGFRPTVIRGYASLIYEFARFLERNKMRLDIPSIITSSETLFAEWRPTIEHFLGGRVFDNYSSREFAIAAQCEYGCYHINDEIVVVEIVNSAGKWVPPGDVGRVLITDLFNWSFPFIRYEIGDIAVCGTSEPCSCNRGLSKLKMIYGRQGDFLRTSDGRLIPNEFFPHLFKDVDGFEEYQIVQDRKGDLRLRLVKGPRYTDRDLQYVTEAITRYFGSGTMINIEFVKSVRTDVSGKWRVVYSEAFEDSHQT